MQQVAEVIRRELSELIIRTIPEDMGLVTVIDVIVNADMKNAQIYIACNNREKIDKIFEFLAKEKNYYQQVIGKKLIMKYTPRLTFKLDKSIDDIDEVEKLLKEIDEK